MHRLKKLTAVVLMVLLFPPLVSANTDTQTPKEWLTWLENLKKEMLSKGISEKTIEKAYGKNDYYHQMPEVVQQDKKQAEFILTSQDYINRLVNSNRVKTARQHYRKLKKKYPQIENEYNVPLNYLTALWAVETNFGQNKGKYHLIDGLTNLSYRNRRSTFFKNELYNVLKIMEKYNLDNDKMMGSWAGAMGHFQFMPSTYNAYAIDYDGDGVVDIWDSFDDALGSASNYLSRLGWKKDEPWGMRVNLPWNFDYTRTGYKVSNTIEEWHKLGVRDLRGKKLKYSPQLKGSIIIPDGRKGAAYIVFGNYKRIMIWNRSENYALAIGILADYIINSENCHPLYSVQQYALTDDEVKTIQIFANKILQSRLKEDGKLGPQTKEAVKKLQARARLHQDGYPDYQLLNKIKKYNPKTGFNVPVPPQKVKKTAEK